MAINQETLRLSEESRAALLQISDGHLNQLVAAWVTHWDELAVELDQSLSALMLGARDGRVSYAAVSKSKRLASALTLAYQRVTELADSVGVIVGEDLPELVRQAYAGQVAMIDSQLPAGQTRVTVKGLDKLTTASVDAMVGRSLGQIHKYTRPLADDVVAGMKSELIRGIAVGDNPRRTAQRIVKRAEGRFNGGLTRAMNIARTETLDMHRKASQLADEVNSDIAAGWRWSASLTARTCPSCLAIHGTVHPISEPGPIDHHMGRCDRVPVTKTWAELGFVGIDEPEDILPDAQEWFDNLTPETQKTIMGAERLQLLQSGQVSWGDLTQRTKNGEWRDSMTVTPVAALRAKGGR